MRDASRTQGQKTRAPDRYIRQNILKGLLTGLLAQSQAAFLKAASMLFSVIRRAPLAVALMLGCATLPAQAGWFSSDDKPAQKTDNQKAAAKPAAEQSGAATNLEDSIRQAQMLRLAAQYPEAIKHLSQLMMVASDDPRIISEYGKTLASMGRASDAVNFLTRAQQLQPGDWTIYSAMGVAYDQLGDQKNAQDAYEHALVLKPDEPSVLSNYALSRMLAKDPDMARKLAARAESGGGMSDVKIVRNIAMIRSLAPEAPVAPPATVAAQAPVAHNQPVAAPQAAKIAPEAHDNRVVMQRVPSDPLAGPVAKPAPVNAATHAPRPLQPLVAAEVPRVEAPAALPKPVVSQPLPPVATVKAEIKPVPVVPEAAKPALVKAVTPAPVPVKTAEAPKPAPIAKATLPQPVKAADNSASASVTLRLAPPLKGETDKPAQPPKVLPAAPVKTADAKPATVAKPKDAMPALRTSANAY
jgi:Flp pilus assembly protein TadD